MEYVKLVEETVQKALDFSLISLSSPKEYFSQNDGELAGFVLFLFYDKKQIGFYKYRINNEMEAHHAVEVDSKYTGQGLGKLLLLSAIEAGNELMPRDNGFIGDTDVTASQREVYNSLLKNNLIKHGNHTAYEVVVSSQDYLKQLQNKT